MVHTRALGPSSIDPWSLPLARMFAPLAELPARAPHGLGTTDGYERSAGLDAQTRRALGPATDPRTPATDARTLFDRMPATAAGSSLGTLGRGADGASTIFGLPFPIFPPPPASPATVRRTERMLKRLGYSTGRVDGQLSATSREALSSFQGALGLPATGNIDAATSRALRRTVRRVEQHGPGYLTQGMTGRRVERLQRRLAHLGDFQGTPNGVYGGDTSNAVRSFRARHGKLTAGIGSWTPRAQKFLERELHNMAHDPYRTRVRPTDASARLDRRAADVAADGGIGAGSPRPVVAHLQRQLVAAGYDPNRTDGVWTDHTAAMVHQFQRRSGLAETERVGASTWRRLAGSTMETTSATRPAQAIGERSRAVLRTERQLARAGLNPGDVDGVYTARTERAVDQIRRHYGVSTDIDGVGPRTARLIDRRVRERNAFQRPIEHRLTPISEFGVPDAEGAPSARGGRYHAGKDWFAPGGARVKSPIAGTIVEVRPSSGSSGQVFGGTVKVQGRDGKVWVFRHVDPSNVRVGQRVSAGDGIARVTSWRDGPSHAHIELWRTLSGGYRYENMIDPMKYLRRFL